jgi:peptidyl-prolyl cis-trans isomerase A (cyclophilin A)
MKHWLLTLLLLPALACAAAKTPAPAHPATHNPVVLMETSYGTLTIELDAAKAPKSVANFLSYVEDGSYDGSLFHRVIPGFVAQGGGYDANFQMLATKPPVVNEARNGLSNQRGTIAMARTQAPDSATRQFYFNLRDNLSLDAGMGDGYTVFGHVTQGLEVLDKIAQQPTGDEGKLGASDVPVEPIFIKRVSVKK